MSALSITKPDATPEETVAEKFCAASVRRYMQIVDRLPRITWNNDTGELIVSSLN